jgi:hypothetical protein
VGADVPLQATCNSLIRNDILRHTYVHAAGADGLPKGHCSERLPR